MPTTALPPKSRSLWPLAIIAYFAVAVAGIVVFVSWAVRQNEDLVRKDYYAEEVQFQRQLDRVNRAREQNWIPTLSYDRTRDAVVIAFANATPSLFGNIQFYRPSDAALDRNIKLSLTAAGAQEIDARGLTGGLWKVRIHWTADSREYSSEESIIINRL